jgi:SPP1 gp7 family putative phage head morphogenesis protein
VSVTLRIRSLALDAKSWNGSTLKGKFKPSTSAEQAFYRQLKKVAQHAGHIVEQHVNGTEIHFPKEMMEELERYSRKLEPWARRQAAKMLETVKNSNKRAYQNKSKAMGLALQVGVAEKDVGETALALMNEQVGLIKSIPLEAGLRAQKIASEAFFAGTRAEANEDTIRQLEEEMGFTTQAAISRAYLIARTETARANASINQARAMSVGSLQYRWHNSGDEAVRPSHRTYKGKRLQGMIFSWNDPPTLDDGMTGHPGTFPNCRCFAEPIFGDE